MPIKIFAAPGDHRDDFREVEKQVNQWEASDAISILQISTCVTPMQGARDVGPFLLTITVPYEKNSDD